MMCFRYSVILEVHASSRLDVLSNLISLSVIQKHLEYSIILDACHTFLVLGLYLYSSFFYVMYSHIDISFILYGNLVFICFMHKRNIIKSHPISHSLILHIQSGLTFPTLY